MLEAVVKMRELVQRPLWFAQVATMSVDDNGDIDAGDILAVAAFTVADEETALNIGLEMHDVIEVAVEKAITYERSQDFVVEILNQLVIKLSAVN